MKIDIQAAEFADVQQLRELYRHEAHCQIIHDSFIGRGFATPYLILVNGRIAGYGAKAIVHYPGRLTEFYLFPAFRSYAQHILHEFIAISETTHIEAQTNMPSLLTLFVGSVKNITDEAILFHDRFTTHLACPSGQLRQTSPADAGHIFEHFDEPVGDWLIEVNHKVVATAGALHHYNPPYADIYMEVLDTARRQGYGSYLIQELKRICYETGKIPSARCGPSNIASRNALQKAGFEPCGRLLVGEVNLR